MRRALLLAARGRFGVSPNPMVGAVLVRSERIVGEGYHREYGGPHAEINALAAAGRRARGADLYVTLEPCCHHGKTPPCAEAVLAAGVARVFFAARDPNPATRGCGPRRLRRAGVPAVLGPCEIEALALNETYFYFRRQGRPWFLLKWAMSLDGKIATASGESQWITGERARRHAHALRRRVDAVLVGTETARLDDPYLGARPPRGRFPFRVVLDRTGRLPLGLRLLREPFLRAEAARSVELAGDDEIRDQESRDQEKLAFGSGQTIYVTSRRASPRRLVRLRAQGVHVLQLPAPRGVLDLDALAEGLGALGLSQVLVEGGGGVAGAFLERREIQEVAAFVAPRLIGGRGAPSPFAGKGIVRLAESPWLERVRVRRLGEDWLVEGRVKSRA